MTGDQISARAIGFDAISTERLVIRPMRDGDATTLAAYRNDPETARHQEWALPFTEDDASRFIAELGAMSWPAPGDWYQLAIEHDGEMIGDIGVGWSDDGRQATIGYTLAPDHRGHGYAAESVGAVVDLLFDLGVHRVSATLDPVNVTSAAVVERLGFRYEGRSPSSAFVRGEWVDDDRYAILADERAEWKARSRSRPQTVSFVEITDDNNREVGRLSTHQSQRHFVATVYESYGDALTPEVDDAGEPLVPWFRAIAADGELVGFVMIADVTGTNPHPYLWRLLVDRRHQGRGIGKRALELLVDQLVADGHGKLFTSWVPGRGSPEGLYLGLGFVPTGEIVDGEVGAVLELRESSE